MWLMKRVKPVQPQIEPVSSPLAQEEIATPGKIEKRSLLNTPLSLKAFIISQTLILTISLLFLGGFYYYLNKDTGLNDWKNRGPVTTRLASLSLDILNPEDDFLTFEKSVVVSGRTMARATVVIINNETPEILEANTKGEFSKVIDLETGPNQLTITAFDVVGNNKSVAKTIYYNEEKI